MAGGRASPAGFMAGRRRLVYMDTAQNDPDAALKREALPPTLEERLAQLRPRKPGLAYSSPVQYNKRMIAGVRERIVNSQDPWKSKGMSQMQKAPASLEERLRHLKKSPLASNAPAISREDVTQIRALVREITQNWDVEIKIDTIIPGEYCIKYAQHFNRLLAYILKGERSDLEDEFLLEEWSVLRRHLLTGLQYIRDAVFLGANRTRGTDRCPSYTVRLQNYRLSLEKLARRHA